jgi:hypothetical protein
MVGMAGLAATAGRVYATGEGPFLNADVGATFLSGLPSGVSSDPGIRFSLVPGYRIYNDDLFSVSLQFDTGFIWNGIKNTADLYQVPFLGGFEYAFHTGSIVEPYIGVAGGGVWSDFEYFTRFGGSDSSVSAAVQGSAGVRFRVSDSVELGVGYKGLGTWPSNVDFLWTHAAAVTFLIRF